MSIKQYIKRGVKYIIRGVPQVMVQPKIVSLAPGKMLVGRTAIITGGTSGIGYEIAKSFLNAGAEVIITGRTIEKILLMCDKLSKETNTESRVFPLVLDNTKIESFDDKIIEAINLSSTKHIDILVNNAGLVGGEVRDCTEEQYDAIMDTNLKGTFFLTKTVANYMKNYGIKGNILNIGSSSSNRPATSAYTITKWGIKGFTMGMAKSLAPYGITVNAIAPGPTATPMLMPEGVKENITFPTNPIGRFAMPEEIANMAVFLVSDMGKTIVGDMIFMTGGLV